MEMNWRKIGAVAASVIGAIILGLSLGALLLFITGLVLVLT